MTLAEKWEGAFSRGIQCAFSPSGHTLALLPMFSAPIMQAIEVHLADRREPLVWEFDNPVAPLAWASDTELVYRSWVWPDEQGDTPTPTFRVLFVESGRSRPLINAPDTMSVVSAGETGHLSVLAEPGGRAGLFDLDVTTGALTRLPAFDAALERLEIYPLFGHAFCAARREVALLAWPRSEYLSPGVTPTEENSHWSPTLDDPAIQEYVDIRPDGTRVTQRELTHEAKRKTPYRLFLLDAGGGCREAPRTHREHRPQWSPDGSLLAFERYEPFDPLRNPGSAGGVWVLRRGDLSLTRVGGCSLSGATIMHPSGALLCNLEDESISFATGKGRARPRSAHWTGFALQNGAARPVRARHVERFQSPNNSGHFPAGNRRISGQEGKGSATRPAPLPNLQLRPAFACPHLIRFHDKR